jgi:hypothetical protein
LTLVLLLALLPLAHGPRVGVILCDAVATLFLVAIFLVVFRSRPQRVVALAVAETAIPSNWGTYAFPDERPSPSARERILR